MNSELTDSSMLMRRMVSASISAVTGVERTISTSQPLLARAKASRCSVGSYNAGYGNINKAFRRAKNKVGEVKQWDQVEPYGPGETRHYVRRIKRLMVTD